MSGINVLEILTGIDQLIWGPPLLVLLVGTGIFLTWKLRMVQVFRLPLALRYVLSSRKTEIGVQGDVSSFGALTTALSSTIGTGNIVGVATAIKTGGPGALFWMLLAGFFGMATMESRSLGGVEVGDTVELTIGGVTREFRVKGIYTTRYFMFGSRFSNFSVVLFNF